MICDDINFWQHKFCKQHLIQRFYCVVLVSHKFGYGLMDLGKMVVLAQSWRKAPIQLIKRLPKVNPDAYVKSTLAPF